VASTATLWHREATPRPRSSASVGPPEHHLPGLRGPHARAQRGDAGVADREHASTRLLHHRIRESSLELAHTLAQLAILIAHVEDAADALERDTLAREQLHLLEPPDVAHRVAARVARGAGGL